MPLWQSLSFGVRTLILKRAAKLSPNGIQRIQRRRLTALVKYTKEHSEFYRELFSHINLTDFELSDLPTTSKMELMDDLDRVFTADELHRGDVEEFFEDECNLGKVFQSRFALSHTSGSQGQPMIIVQPLENLELLYALQASRGNHEDVSLTEIVEHLVTPARVAAVTLNAGFYPSASAIQHVPEAARQFLKVLQLSSTDDDLIGRLNDFRPTHLTSYASVLHELARQVEAGKLVLKPHVKQVVNISERLIPKTRDYYTTVFGAPVLDDYAMGECLFLSNGCPTSGGMHVNSDWAILEVVDEKNRPVPDGEPGAKVLVTNLANWALPFIRYEVGDIVTMATEPCGCGSNLPLIERVDGRDSDIFHISDSGGQTSITPIMFEHALAHVVDAREYQIIQEQEKHFRIRVEPLPGKRVDVPAARRAIQKHLESYQLNRQLNVEVEIAERLQGDDNQKFKRVVSKLDQPVKKRRRDSTAA